jgi:hypothetical protein
VRSTITLDFDRARVSGSFLGAYTARGPLRCDGSLRLLGAVVNGPVFLPGAQVREDVVLNAAEVDDDLYLAPEGGHRTDVSAPVTLYGARRRRAGVERAKVGGELNLLGLRR